MSVDIARVLIRPEEDSFGDENRNSSYRGTVTLDPSGFVVIDYPEYHVRDGIDTWWESSEDRRIAIPRERVVEVEWGDEYAKGYPVDA